MLGARKGEDWRQGVTVQTIPPKIASEMLWNVEPWVRQRGAWRGGAGVCQAEEGVRQASKAGRATRRASNREVGELHHPEPETLA